MSEQRDKDVRRWLASNLETVKQSYTKPSKRKIAIEIDIWDDMENVYGARYSIRASECHYFTCGFAYKKQDDWCLRVYRNSSIIDYTLTDAEVREAGLGE